MGRVLGRIRLSHLTDESTSVERQRDVIKAWADTHDHEIIGWATDVDVSRSVDPFDTPDLGQWLTDPDRIKSWDIVATWKLDRLATGSIFLNKLMAWCQQQEKVIVSVTESFDLSTWVGRMIANVIAGVAEGELEAIKERTSASRTKLRDLGRWAGGAPVYGLMAVSRGSEDAGYELKRDPEAYDHSRFIIERAIAGDSYNSIAQALNNRGVFTPQDLRRRQRGKTPRGGRWRANTVISILGSPTLLGYMSHEGKTVLGPDGMPVKAGEALVSMAEWKQLQARLKAAQRRRTQEAALLLDIAFCGACGAKLHRQSSRTKTANYAYYRCSTLSANNGECSNRSYMRATHVEEVTIEILLGEIGDVEITRKVLLPGEDHTAELLEAEQALEELMTQAGAARSERAKKLFRDQMTSLDERIARLETQPNREDQWVDVGTGVTYRQRWDGDPAERRQLLLDSGITVKVTGDPWSLDLSVPEDIRERIAK